MDQLKTITQKEYEELTVDSLEGFDQEDIQKVTNDLFNEAKALMVKHVVRRIEGTKELAFYSAGWCPLIQELKENKNGLILSIICIELMFISFSTKTQACESIGNYVSASIREHIRQTLYDAGKHASQKRKLH